jgi:hypothetical protein
MPVDTPFEIVYYAENKEKRNTIPPEHSPNKGKEDAAVCKQKTTGRE